MVPDTSKELSNYKNEGGKIDIDIAESTSWGTAEDCYHVKPAVKRDWNAIFQPSCIYHWYQPLQIYCVVVAHMKTSIPATVSLHDKD